MAPRGSSSEGMMELMQDTPEGVIIAGSAEELKTWAGYIMYFLEKQPASWEEHWTLESVVLRIVKQELIPVLYFRNNEVLGLGLVSLQQYSSEKLSMRLEFVSCENFFSITGMLDVLEERARLLGCYSLEAVAHPTLAKYLQKKKGFGPPQHYVTKKLKARRIH